MKIILTKRDLKKPLKINGQKEEENDREVLLRDFIKNPEIIKKVVITKNCISVETI